jgi:SAM-dependent methyltransferase
LKGFVDRGDRCFLVDYVRDTVDGVTKLGDTLDELPSEERFDGIVCSHVIEHVAQPWELLSHLVRHLTPEGRIYVEVPMEIWKKPPLQEEPVTHVNFFSAPSLHYLMMRCGLRVDECVTRVLKVPGSLHVVVHAIGGINPARPLELPRNGEAEVRKLLNPGFFTKLWWLSLHPDFLTGAIRSATGRVFRR